MQLLHDIFHNKAATQDTWAGQNTMLSRLERASNPCSRSTLKKTGFSPCQDAAHARFSFQIMHARLLKEGQYKFFPCKVWESRKIPGQLARGILQTKNTLILSIKSIDSCPTQTCSHACKEEEKKYERGQSTWDFHSWPVLLQEGHGHTSFQFIFDLHLPYKYVILLTSLVKRCEARA
jgi:hypothetical protein